MFQDYERRPRRHIDESEWNHLAEGLLQQLGGVSLFHGDEAVVEEGVETRLPPQMWCIQRILLSVEASMRYTRMPLIWQLVFSRPFLPEMTCLAWQSLLG